MKEFISNIDKYLTTNEVEIKGCDTCEVYWEVGTEYTIDIDKTDEHYFFSTVDYSDYNSKFFLKESLNYQDEQLLKDFVESLIMIDTNLKYRMWKKENIDKCSTPLFLPRKGKTKKMIFEEVENGFFENQTRIYKINEEKLIISIFNGLEFIDYKIPNIEHDMSDVEYMKQEYEKIYEQELNADIDRLEDEMDELEIKKTKYKRVMESLKIITDSKEKEQNKLWENLEKLKKEKNENRN